MRNVGALVLLLMSKEKLSAFTVEYDVGCGPGTDGLHYNMAVSFVCFGLRWVCARNATTSKSGVEGRGQEESCLPLYLGPWEGDAFHCPYPRGAEPQESRGHGQAEGGATRELLHAVLSSHLYKSPL